MFFLPLSLFSVSVPAFPASWGVVIDVQVVLIVPGLSVAVAVVAVLVIVGVDRVGATIQVPVPVPVVTFFGAAWVCDDVPTPTPMPTTPLGLFTMSGVSDRTTGLRMPGAGGLAGACGACWGADGLPRG